MAYFYFCCNFCKAKVRAYHADRELPNRLSNLLNLLAVQSPVTRVVDFTPIDGAHCNGSVTLLPML